MRTNVYSLTAFLFHKGVNVVCMLLVLLAINLKMNAQCTNGSAFGTGAAPTGGGITVLTTCAFAGEYSTITGVAATTQYISTSSIPTDFITIHQGTSNGPVIAFGTTPLSWTSTVAGNYYQHVNTSAACGSQSSCRTLSIQHFVPCGAPPCYCTSTATSSADEDILNVTLGTLNNSSTCATVAPGPGSVQNRYSNYTSGAGAPAAPTLTAGSAIPFSVQVGSCGGNFTNSLAIWIDYNQDGTFSLAERVYVSAAGTVGPHIESGNITVPLTATSGVTRMRVVNVETGTPGNISACGTYTWGETEDYNVNIFIPPCIITCPANITAPSDPGQCGAIVNYPAPTTSGVCGPVTTTPASGSFFPRGTTTVTATEPGGGICTFTITVNDVQPPTITCPANITVNNSPGQCGAFVSFPAPTTTDNCPGVVVTSVPASGSLFPSGTTTVTSTATDAGGNTATCTFTVTVNDITPPTITCPANITVGNDLNNCSAVVNYPLPTYSDNCGMPGPVALSQNTSNSVGPVIQIGCQAGGFNTANSYWRAYNLASYNLAGALTVNSVTFGIETANANGTGTTQPVTVRLWTSAGAFPAGVRTLVGTQVVNVPDQTVSLFTATFSTPVTVPANAILVVELFTPDGRAPVNNVFFVGSNNLGQSQPCYISAADCGVASPVTLASLGFPNMHIILNINGVVAGPNPLTLVSGLAPGSVFPLGTTTNTYRVTDVAGNTATCSFNVTVNDTQNPTITCPGNITVTTPVGSCTANVTYAVTSTDNCPGVTQALQAGLASGSAFPLGVNTVTWRATDAVGNTSTCSFTVTVLDGQLPVISAQPANRTVCAGTNATFSVTSSNALTYQWQEFNGTAWVDIAGATASSYTVNSATVAMNTKSYRVRIAGLCTTIFSNHATLFVNPLPSVQLSATPTPVLLPTQTTTITATTNPSGGSFVWSLNGQVIAGVTGSSLSGIGVDALGLYRVTYTDPNGCVSTSADLEVKGAFTEGLWVYPNPNSGNFLVRYFNAANEGATVNIYDEKGSRVYQQSLVTSPFPYTQIEINLGTRIPSGTYVVEVVNGSGKKVGSKRIIVTR